MDGRDVDAHGTLIYELKKITELNGQRDVKQMILQTLERDFKQTLVKKGGGVERRTLADSVMDIDISGTMQRWGQSIPLMTYFYL